MKMPQGLKITRKLLDVFQNIEDEEQKIDDYIEEFLYNREGRSFESDVNKYFKSIRDKKSERIKKIIDSYLSLDVYPAWLQK